MSGPSAELGNVLATRIGNGAEVVPDHDHDGWLVALKVVSNKELIALLSLIQGWLRAELLDRAEVHLDGRNYLLESP